MCNEHARCERADHDPAGKAAALEKALFNTPIRLSAWVAESQSRAIGFATVTTEFSTWSACEFLHMDCLFVRESHRGAGAGAALLSNIMQFAREQRCPEIQWQTPAWNTAAERFYRREGAVAKPKLRFVLRAY